MNDAGLQVRKRRQLARLAWLLDDSVRIPIIGRRIGLDSLIGLVPVVGDAAGAIISGYVMLSAVRLGVSIPTAMVMLFNVGVEFVVGAVPLVGDLFDMGWKANQRNVRIMQAHLDAPEATSRNSRLTVAVAALLVILVLVALAVAATWLAIRGGQAILGLI